MLYMLSLEIESRSYKNSNLIVALKFCILSIFMAAQTYLHVGPLINMSDSSRAIMYSLTYLYKINIL